MTACAVCDRTLPRYELASINGVRYCHQDQAEPTCYERASQHAGNKRLVRDYDAGVLKLSADKSICQQCGEQFEAERSSAKFCSNACKQRAKRRLATR